MILINFSKNDLPEFCHFKKVSFPDKAEGWKDQIYYSRVPKVENVTLNTSSTGVNISGKNWNEIGSALDNDDKTRGHYLYDETIHTILDADNANYKVSLRLRNDYSSSLDLNIFVNSIIQKNIRLPPKTSTLCDFDIALSKDKFDLYFAKNKCDTPQNWKVTLQSIKLEQLPVKSTNKKLGIYIASDSTAQTYSLKEEPQSGWGEELYHQLKGKFVSVSNSSFYPQATRYDLDNIFVDNRSLGARSSKTFITEGRLQSLLMDIAQGDYLLIQFGDNDNTSYRPNRYVPTSKFGSYLKQYVESAIKRAAHPILISPPTQFKYDEEKHKFKTIFEPYADVMRKISRQYHIPMIEQGKNMTELLNSMGYDAAHIMFLQVAKEDYPNLSETKHDITHFQHYGAFQLAKMISKSLAQITTSKEFTFKNYNEDYRPIINHKLNKISLRWHDIVGSKFYVIKEITSSNQANKYVTSTTHNNTYVDISSDNTDKRFQIVAYDNENKIIATENITVR